MPLEFAKWTEVVRIGGPRYEVGTIQLYVLVDPRDGTVRYVGATKNSLGRRLMHHMSSPLRSCAAWFAELRAAQLFAEIVSVGFVRPEGWARAERRWISYLRNLGRLYNVHDGGNSTAPWATEAARAKRAAEREERKRRRKSKGRRRKSRRPAPPKDERRVARKKDANGLWRPAAWGEAKPLDMAGQVATMG